MSGPEVQPSDGQSTVAQAGQDAGAVPSSRSSNARGRRELSSQIGAFSQRYGVLIAFAAVVLFFSLEANEFLTLGNIRSVLSGAAPLIVLAAVLTVPMVMGDFDLSVGYNTQVLGGVGVTLMAFRHWDAGSAIIGTVVLGAIIGGLLGWLIAWSKVSAFVITLGAGILLSGVELRITQGHTIFSGLSQSYINLASRKLLTFTLPVWIALVVCLALWYVTRHTVLGRRMAAVGGNQEAARLSGINVDLMRTAGFVIVGIGAAIAAVIITAQAASSYPDSATGLLIPAYAGVFIGASVLRPGEFHVWGTLIGVLFMSFIQNGLILMNYGSSTANVIQGAIFIVAVLSSRIGRRSRA
jgi:ribose transport system permease protein